MRREWTLPLMSPYLWYEYTQERAKLLFPHGLIIRYFFTIKYDRSQEYVTIVLFFAKIYSY